MKLVEEVEAVVMEAICIGFDQALEEKFDVGRIELESLAEMMLVC